VQLVFTEPLLAILSYFFPNYTLYLKKLHTSTLEYIVCGDINVDYVINNDRKSRLDILLKIYNLRSVVNFPTRIQKIAATAIDNILIDTSKMRNHSISPIINGLSDHDVQLITLHSYTSEPSLKNIY